MLATAVLVCVAVLCQEAASMQNTTTATLTPGRSTFEEYVKMNAAHIIEPNSSKPEYHSSVEYLRFPYSTTLAEYFDVDNREQLRGTIENGVEEKEEVLNWKARHQDYDDMKEYGESRYDYMKPFHKSVLTPTVGTILSRRRRIMEFWTEIMRRARTPEFWTEGIVHARLRRTLRDLVEGSVHALRKRTVVDMAEGSAHAHWRRNVGNTVESSKLASRKRTVDSIAESSVHARPRRTLSDLLKCSKHAFRKDTVGHTMENSAHARQKRTVGDVTEKSAHSLGGRSVEDDETRLSDKTNKDSKRYRSHIDENGRSGSNTEQGTDEEHEHTKRYRSPIDDNGHSDSNTELDREEEHEHTNRYRSPIDENGRSGSNAGKSKEEEHEHSNRYRSPFDEEGHSDSNTEQDDEEHEHSKRYSSDRKGHSDSNAKHDKEEHEHSNRYRSPFDEKGHSDSNTEQDEEEKEHSKRYRYSSDRKGHSDSNRKQDKEEHEHTNRYRSPFDENGRSSSNTEEGKEEEHEHSNRYRSPFDEEGHSDSNTEQDEERGEERDGESSEDDYEGSDREDHYDDMNEEMFNRYNNVSTNVSYSRRDVPPGLPFSDSLLQVLSGVWYIRMPDGNLSKISYQGDGRGAPRAHHYALTENGLFYKFEDPPIEFMRYLITLPIRYDQTRLAFDGKFFLARLGRNSPFSKLVKEGLRGYEDGLLHALDDRGIWHSFRDTPEMQALKDYLSELPKTAAIYDNHRLTETPYGKWLIKNRAGVYKKVKVQGNCILFVRGDNGVFFKLLNPPEAFKKFLVELPVQIKDPYNIHTSYMLGY